jgi:hypothetical protein
MATGKGAAASDKEGKSQPFQFVPGPFDPATWLEWSRQWVPEANGDMPSGFPAGMAGAFPVDSRAARHSSRPSRTLSRVPPRKVRTA